MHKKLLLFFFCMIFMISFISAVPPITTEFVGVEGFEVEANVQPYYITNEGAEVHIFVFP